ncbi:methyltransferase [Streptomyces caniscabiei]|uniref:Methyltransferase n=2 Tax=Streptomyces caniscabiei TaxID=2746961 RepID=A0A927L6A1_9ACTN|nr:HemK2/MTQ2 family protein methyltransferase [Streptomyces caniscabiei]MBD9726875.1 methyltransferase [Streptomyces caniscabiei]MDX3513726.1 methyltransferase [Streptomyces caniscabiei]MDX3722583.1 methyltransferase [Streptomyces caniscabiei]MDX3733014.1 methyltransferase [Streptomyces caniscabiei]WEO23295.1 methyltransferase [Streptomyces caniscabiei]
MAALTLVSTSTLLLTPPGVYAPQWDTELLMRALCREDIGPSTDVLDLGTGSGAVAVQAARLGARVTAVDISWLSVITARVNALLARRRVRVRHGDLTTAVAGSTYDLVISNPPYVPSPADRIPRNGRARAWEAGRDGRVFVDRLCAAAPRMLRPGGTLLVVHSDLCGTDTTLRRLEKAGLCASVVDRAEVPYGPVLRSRRPWLVHQGLIAEDDTQEELVVIRAERP